MIDLLKTDVKPLNKKLPGQKTCIILLYTSLVL